MQRRLIEFNSFCPTFRFPWAKNKCGVLTTGTYTSPLCYIFTPSLDIFIGMLLFDVDYDDHAEYIAKFTKQNQYRKKYKLNERKQKCSSS